ncbi:helix-turn-helix domain-containing protein [Acidaminococcus intestini]
MTGTESINREVGRRIKLCRRSKGVTLAELGAAVGLSESQAQRYEAGKIGNVAIELIKKMAAVLDTTPEYLMGWTNDYYTNPETARLAQEAYDNPDMRLLMDAARDLTPEDLKIVLAIVKKMRK